MTRRQTLLIAAVVVVAIAGFVAWRWLHPAASPDALTLYGNVDLRQVELAFNNADRIDTVLVEEGDHVRKGQVVARLDVRRLKPLTEAAQAQVDAQAAVVQRLEAGNRPQEIAQARDTLAVAQAEAQNAHALYSRSSQLWNASAGQASLSHQDLDNARAAMDAADARQAASRHALELETIGPRKEDIDQARAQLRANRAQLDVLRQQLIDAELISPVDGVVRSRLLEAGEMATPQRPVYNVAVTTPKWVRAYVTEADLARVHPHTAATVTTDGSRNRAYQGWVGYIASVAEFTPRTVQTTDLRTSLVYEIRVFVTDPADELRLGMPATVQLHLADAGRRP